MRQKDIKKKIEELRAEYSAQMVKANAKHQRRLGDINHCYTLRLSAIQSVCKHKTRESTRVGYEARDIWCADCGKDLS